MDKLVVKDYTSKNTQPCCICDEKIDAMVSPDTGKEIWIKGHNALPVKDGRCCSDCNNKIVVPLRIMGTISSKVQKIGDLSTDALKDYDTATLTEVEIREGTDKLKKANKKLSKARKIAQQIQGLLNGLDRKLDDDKG
tara:strand:- start:11 stop:424 length:414 start_codon:yes stop_codon:yes gene_type:complete